jgi:hypothetical protein
VAVTLGVLVAVLDGEAVDVKVRLEVRVRVRVAVTLAVLVAVLVYVVVTVLDDVALGTRDSVLVTVGEAVTVGGVPVHVRVAVYEMYIVGDTEAVALSVGL